MILYILISSTNTYSNKCNINKVNKNKKIIGREMRLTVKIDEFEMGQVFLDLGNHANVLPKQTWERMGQPKL